MKKAKYRKLFRFIIIFLITANVFIWSLILYQQHNKKPILGSYYLNNSKKKLIPEFALESSNGEIFHTRELNSKLNILIFFSLSDCPGCLHEAEYWGMAHNMTNRENLTIWAVTQIGNKETIDEFCKEYDINFPVLNDKEDIVKAKVISFLELAKFNLISPFKIYLNSSGEVILVEGPVKQREEQQLFLEKIFSFIQSYTP